MNQFPRETTLHHLAWSHPHRHAPKAGISLIEILMSIGVMLIGLLGVLALFPAALHQNEQANIEDRKAQAGRRAVREFNIRDMENTEHWIHDNYTNPSDRRQSFCIDPMFFTNGFFNSSLAGQPWSLPLGGNPYEVNNPNEHFGYLHRVTLKADPIVAQAINNRMLPAQANALFSFGDDLVMERPAELGQPTEQTVLGLDSDDGIVNTQNETPWKRLAQNNFSWMATLVPEPSLNSDLYHLSVIIFHKRIADPTLFTDETAPENPVRVTAFLGAGMSGGDVQLEVVNNSLPAWLHLQALNPGDWLILHQRRATNGGPDMPYFRWYRIVSAQESPGTKTLPANAAQRRRIVTLQGPDWLPNAAADSAILMRNVVGVYEKTIRLEH